MRFQRYSDGVVRATIRVEFTPSAEDVAHAVALDAYGGDDALARRFIANLTKRHCVQIVRDQFFVSGPREQWAEMGEDEEYDTLVELAERRVRVLFPEIEETS